MYGISYNSTAKIIRQRKLNYVDDILKKKTCKLINIFKNYYLFINNFALIKNVVYNN